MKAIEILLSRMNVQQEGKQQHPVTDATHFSVSHSEFAGTDNATT